MAEIEKLDKICERIFLYLGLKEEKIGFNELYRSLKKAGFKTSKPTLSEHLKHLTKKKVLIRKKVSKQRITYEINWEHFKHLLDAREYGKEMEKQLDDPKVLESYSVEDYLSLAKLILNYIDLQQLRLSILAILNPEKAFEYNLELLFISRFFNIIKNWIIQECREDQEFGKKILQKIENRLEAVEHMIPDPQQTHK